MSHFWSAVIAYTLGVLLLAAVIGFAVWRAA